jgi:lysophospholipase L1-like esterase
MMSAIDPLAVPKPLPPKTSSRWPLKLMTAILAVLLGGALTELALRVYVAARGWTSNCYAMTLQMYRPHPTIGADLRPGFRFKSGVFDISFNSRGLRGPELVLNDNRPRIAVLGGSGAFGYLVSDKETKTAHLQQLFEETECPVEVINAGVPGYNLNETIIRFEEVVAPLKPKFVVLYLGWNDGPYIIDDDPESERFTKRWAPSPWQYAASHSILYGLVWSRWPTVRMHLAPPADARVIPTAAGKARFHKNLERLATAISATGAKLVVSTMVQASRPDVPDDVAAYLSPDPQRRRELIALGEWTTNALRQFAVEHDAILIDACRDIPPTAEVLGDAIHLTAAGERRVAELWFATLLPLIGDACQKFVSYSTGP